MATPVYRGNGSTYGSLPQDRFEQALKAAIEMYESEPVNSTRRPVIKGKIGFLIRQQRSAIRKGEAIAFPIPGSGKFGWVE